MLACNSEQFYATILEFYKNKDLSQNCQTYSRQILEISGKFLDMVSVNAKRKRTANVRHKISEGKQRWKAAVIAC